MTELIKQDIEQSEWYKSLIDNILDTFNHYNVTVIETLQQCYWEIGAQINQAKEYFHKAGIEANDNICNAIAKNTGKSQRTIYYAIKLNETFKNPIDIPTIPWNKLIKQYLTESKKIGQIEHKHDFSEKWLRCSCGKWKKDIAI